MEDASNCFSFCERHQHETPARFLLAIFTNREHVFELIECESVAALSCSVFVAACFRRGSLHQLSVCVLRFEQKLIKLSVGEIHVFRGTKNLNEFRNIEASAVVDIEQSKSLLKPQVRGLAERCRLGFLRAKFSNLGNPFKSDTRIFEATLAHPCRVVVVYTDTEVLREAQCIAAVQFEFLCRVELRCFRPTAQGAKGPILHLLAVPLVRHVYITFHFDLLLLLLLLLLFLLLFATLLSLHALEPHRMRHKLQNLIRHPHVVRLLEEFGKGVANGPEHVDESRPQRR
mmetsp:Transcript_86260/g.139967  ORF Transcript_86260/g.139967 Transcript_86260/m.139967 type:complete len:287 (+) Transcript_86260:3120-3980(+)